MSTENLRVEDVDAMDKGDLEKFVAKHEIEVTGTGAGGNILKTDLEVAVKRYLEQLAASDPEPAAAEPAADAEGEQPAEDQPDAAPSESEGAEPPAAEPAAAADTQVDDEDDDEEPAGDYVEVRLKIERTTGDGDWWDPFSGHAMHHSVDVCPINGARRDGDEAVLVVPAEEAGRYGDR